MLNPTKERFKMVGIKLPPSLVQAVDQIAKNYSGFCQLWAEVRA